MVINDKNEQLEALITDLTKAFETNNHPILLDK